MSVAPVHPQKPWLSETSIIVIGSRNQDKLAEYRSLLNGYGHTIIDLNQLEKRLGLSSGALGNVDEPGVTHEENANIKARSIAEAIRAAPPPGDIGDYVVLADDSGIEAGASKWRAIGPDDLGKDEATLLAERKNNRLAGRPFPGVDTAQVEKDAGSIEGIYECYAAAFEPNDVTRSMRTITVIAALALKDNGLRYFRGEVLGRLADEPRGNIGSGYDLCFVPNGFTETYAEMPLLRKLNISERRVALVKLLRSLKPQTGFDLTEMPKP